MSKSNTTKVLEASGMAGGFRDGPSSIIMEEGDFDHDSQQRSPGDYYFKFQFFVHECILLKDFFNV
jgi:hypothetical protein